MVTLGRRRQWRRRARRPHVVVEGKGADVEGQLSGLQNPKPLNKVSDELGGQPECINEVSVELGGQPKHLMR